MPTRGERLFRLEASSRAAAMAARAVAGDQADFDRRVAAIRTAGVMPDGYPIEPDQDAAWAIGRAMLATFSGSAELFARTTMLDYLC